MDAIKITYLFFSQCNLFKTFLIIFQINQVFPENMLPRVFPVLKGRLINFCLLQTFSFCLFTGFCTQQLENLRWPFLVLERPLCMVEEAFLLWGPDGPLFSGTFPKVILEAEGFSLYWFPPYWHQGFQRAPLLVPGDIITLLLQWELARYAFPHFLLPFFKKTCGIKPNFLIVVLLDIVNTVLYLLSQH